MRADRQVLGAIANHQAESGHGYAYNTGTGLRRWRSKLARLAAGASETINLCVIGDSITEGARSDANPANWIATGYVGLIRSALAAKYGDVGTGFIPTFYAAGSPFWTFGGTWLDGTTFGIAGMHKKTEVNGSTATLAFNGTGIRIVMVLGPLGGTMDFAVDGVGAGSIDTYAASINPAFVHEITGLSAGDHTLVITSNLTSGEYIWLLGACPLKGVTGVRVNMCGRSASEAYQAATPDAMKAEIDIWTPALTIVAYTTNDYSEQRPLASYAANLQLLVTRALTYGDCLLVSVAPRNVVYPIPQASYVEVMKQVALKNGAAFLDLFARWKTPSYAANTLGFMDADNVHPNAYGHQDIATAILAQILE